MPYATGRAEAGSGHELDMSKRLHAVVLARLVIGTTLLLEPDAIPGANSSRRSEVAIRALGARHLLEAIVVNVRPTPGIAAAGAAVDAIHALSALGLAAAVSRYRRLALLNAAGASAFALAGARHARALALDYPRS
jgi:hypothetical protein